MSMVIFNCYVKLPEGNGDYNQLIPSGYVKIAKENGNL